MKKLTALISGFIIIPIIAGAGGMERTALPTAFMFEEGGYGEITFSNRGYDVTDNMFAPTNSMYGDVSGVSFPANLILMKLSVGTVNITKQE